MNKIQKLIIILFILTLILFGGFEGRKYLSRDTEGPEISCKEDTVTASIAAADKDLLKGVSAVDAKDGDVSDSLIIESIQIVEGNECTVNYAAFDHSNNVSKYSRTLVYEDYRSPHFTVSRPLRFVLGNKNEILKAVGANDCIEGNITNRVKLVSKDEESEYTGAGIYNYELQVTNSIGDTAILPISVEFYADSYEERLFHPTIYLTAYVTYLKKDSEFEPRDYLDSVEIGNALYVFDENIGTETEVGGDEESSVQLTDDGRQIAGSISYEDVKYQSNVKTREPGVYTVEYSCTTKDGYLGTTQMIVVVE